MALKDFFNPTGTNTLGAYGVNWNAQTFTAGSSYNLTSLKLSMRRFNSPGNVIVSIRNTTTGVPSGSDLAFVIVNGNNFQLSLNLEEFILNVPVSIIQGQTYAIIVRATEGNSSNDAKWHRQLADAYAGGMGYSSTNSGNNWTALSTRDFSFQAYSVDTVSGRPFCQR